jgi:hypothetical protein
MSLLNKILGRDDADTEREDYDAMLAHESAKVRAFRTADEVAEAARVLMQKALELREEIEELPSE